MTHKAPPPVDTTWAASSLGLETEDWRPPPPQLIAGRYRTLRPLGDGGQGTVDLAEDVLTGEHVAIKRLRAATPRAVELARREVTTLRWLRLPGVVRFRDDGVDGLTWYIVMDVVDWPAFPGPGAGLDWEALRGPTLGLLRALVPVHDLGLVHADLKPGNVKVGPEGQVMLLDFGIATGHALPPGAEGALGTAGYIDPVRFRGRPADARSDLYAVGRMVLRALGERRPPEEVLGVLRSLVEPEPERRPPGAREVLAALGDQAPEVSGAPDELALRALFLGPEPFLHIPSDAARILWARTQGDPAGLRAELDRWVHAGLATWEPGGLRVGRLALEQLEHRPEEARLDALLGGEGSAEGLATEALATEALAVARWWKRDGRPRRAMAVLDRVLPRIRAEAPRRELEVLALRTGVALALESLQATDEALVELGRSARRGPELEGMEALLRASRAALEGSHLHARTLAEALEPYEDEEHEVWRAALVLRSAARVGAEEAGAMALEGWACTPSRRARWLGWVGNLRYAQGRYAESAACWLEAAEGRVDRDSRLAALRGAAAAMLEVPDPERAQELASLVAAEARLCGNEKLEAYAVRVQRVARYRLGLEQQADEALVEAAEQVEPSVAGMLGLCEAAIAWRSGQRALGRRLALRGERGFRAAGRPEPALLCQALVQACGQPAPEEVAALAQAAQGCRLPEFTLQILALAWGCTPHPDPAWREVVRDRVDRLSLNRRSLRLDILSCEEALERVGQDL